MSPRFQSITPGARLSDQVADALAEEIRQGRLNVGDKLPTEAELVTQFGVSRTVVREAVSRLKSLGLVDSRQGSGVYVREVSFSPLNFDARHTGSRDAVIQMVEVRRGLEAEVAALAALRRTPRTLQAIRDAITALDEATGDGVAEDVRFHRAIAEAAGNPFLLGTLEYLGQFLHGATRVTRANEARRRDFVDQVRQEHLAIVEAIAAGDSPRARQAAAAHMDNAIGRIQQADASFWSQEGAQLAQPLVERRSG